ncbi:MAG: hypothetical protein ACTSP3_01955 [Candidatus Heimdallarchaeaceae archaeon]
MSRCKIAIIGVPKKGSIKKPIQKILEMGANFLLLLQHEDDSRILSHIEEIKHHLSLVDNDRILLPQSNLYSAAIELFVFIINQIEKDKPRECTLYLANTIEDFGINAVIDVCTNWLSSYCERLNTRNRRERYPRYSIIRCIWDNVNLLEYPLPLIKPKLEILEQIGNLLQFNERITISQIHKMIQDSNSPNVPSKSLIQDYLKHLKKSLDGFPGFEDHITKGFKFRLELQ